MVPAEGEEARERRAAVGGERRRGAVGAAFKWPGRGSPMAMGRKDGCRVLKQDLCGEGSPGEEGALDDVTGGLV